MATATASNKPSRLSLIGGADKKRTSHASGHLGGSRHGSIHQRKSGAGFAATRPSTAGTSSLHDYYSADSDLSLSGDAGSNEFVADEQLKKDKVKVVVPKASMKQNTQQKLTQFCTEKLVQSQRRLTKLYGREKEIQFLKQEFEKVCASSAEEVVGEKKSYRSLVLIGGLSGEGKTALALELQKLAKKKQQSAALFVLGKYDLANMGEPYSGIKAALGQLCHDIASFPQERLQKLRQTVHENLSWEMDLLCQVIPDLTILLGGGNDDAVPKEEGAGQKNKLKTSIRSSMRNMLRSSVSRSMRSSFRAGIDDSTNADADKKEAENNNNQQQQLEATGAGGADRLRFALRKVINVISGFAPLVFVCDDAQWADKASIDLLQAWITDEANRSLLLVWTYRSNMVDSTHVVSKSIEEIKSLQEERSIDSIEEIRVENLQQHDVNAMIADTLDIAPKKSEDLTNIIYHKTLGNVFFVMQYLQSLAQKGLLTFNMAIMGWVWDIEEIRSGSTATQNVVDLMKEKLQESPLASKLLPLAACIGATFDTRVLGEIIYGMKVAQEAMLDSIFLETLGENYKEGLEATQLEEIEKEGLIEAAGASSYAFIHDKVIEGSLALIEEDRLDSLRFGLGLILFDRVKEVEDRWVEETLFLMVNLLNSQVDKIPEHQRMDVCALNQEAGDKAFLAAAYSRSALYYGAAIKLLPEGCWKIMYEDTLHLYSAASESEMCLGNYEQMRAYAEEIQKQDLPVLDQLPSYRVLVTAHAGKGELQEAWNLNTAVLHKIGFDMPRSALKARTKAALANMMLRKKKWKPDALNMLPVSTDPIDEAISQMHDIFIIAVQAVIPEGFLLAIITACKHILDRGLNKYAATPLAWLGLIINNVHGDLQWGREHAEFTHSLLQKLPNRRIEPRVNMITNIFVLHWTSPIHNSIKPLIASYSKGMETCDMDSGFWCAQFYHESSLYAGKNLALLAKDAEIYCKQEKDYGMIKHLECLQSVHQLILNLRGQSSNTTLLTGSAHNQEAVLRMLEQAPDAHHFSHVQKDRLFACAIFGDFDLGAQIGMAHLDTICYVLGGQHSTVMSRFVVGLSCFAMASKTKKKKYLKVALQNLKIMTSWLGKGNPNTQHYMLFLKAEKAAYEGKKEKALSFYDRAILLAGRSGYNHDRALACERLAAYQMKLGDADAARIHFDDALRLYEEWGAEKKVELLRDHIKQMLP